MERKIGGPADEVGSDDRGSIEGVVPVLGCAFPFADVGLRGPAVDSLEIQKRGDGYTSCEWVDEGLGLTVNLGISLWLGGGSTLR